MTTSGTQTARTFAADPQSVAEARAFTRRTLEEWGASDVADDAVLVVSELVTNAITHAGTPTTLEVRLVPGGIWLDVEDLHPSRMIRMGADPTESAEYGRGLLITSMLGSAWGIEYRPDRKRVWALLRRPDEPDEALDEVEAGGDLPMRHPDGGPRSRPVPAPASGELDPLGLRNLTLNWLGLDELLGLVAERVQDRLSAAASYLLLAHGFDDDYQVAAIRGLPEELRGRVVDRHAAGLPVDQSPLLPIVVPDLDRVVVPMLAGTTLRSLVVVPVVFEGRVVGVLGAASEDLGAFGEDQAAVLQRSADWVASSVDRARLRAAERQRSGWLSFLAEAGAMLADSLDPGMTIAITGQIVVPRLATWCAVYLDDERGRPSLQQVWHEDERLIGPVRAALEEAGESEVEGAVVRVPLVARAKRIGTLVLGQAAGEPLRGERLLVAESIARRAALAIDNARAHDELRAAGHTLQRSLLPATMPVVPGVDVGVVYEPAGTDNAAGGDFYDLFSIGSGRWCFVVGDVCGTGPEAATVTGLARHTVRALVRSGFPIGTTLERLNQAILDEGDRARFLTLVCGTLDLSAGARYRMGLVCAGHPPPFLVPADGSVRRVGRPQPLLGVLDQVEYVVEEHQLRRGDTMVLVTDGVLERRSGRRMLDDDGVVAELAGAGGFSAQMVADRLSNAVAGFADEPSQDDLAILVLRMGLRGPG